METNPYQAPDEATVAAGQLVSPAVRPNWRVIPAGIAGCLGLGTALLGAMAAGSAVVRLYLDATSTGASSGPLVAAFLAVRLLPFVIAIAMSWFWLASAIAFWQCRWKDAILRFAMAGAIVAVPALLLFGAGLF